MSAAPPRSLTDAAAANGGSQRVGWHNCTFRDTSSGALMLGGLDTCDEKDTSKWDRDFTVSDCTITNMPVEYTGATAVFFGYIENSTLEHTLLENMSYSAMTIGCAQSGSFYSCCRTIVWSELHRSRACVGARGLGPYGLRSRQHIDEGGAVTAPRRAPLCIGISMI